MKSFQKSKSIKKTGQKDDPNASGPGFRTSNSFRGKFNVGKKGGFQAKFNPASFKVQHKG
jgi:hypothetical protein